MTARNPNQVPDQSNLPEIRTDGVNPDAPGIPENQLPPPSQESNNQNSNNS